MQADCGGETSACDDATGPQHLLCAIDMPRLGSFPNSRPTVARKLLRALVPLALQGASDSLGISVRDDRLCTM